MFTGIVEEIGILREVRPTDQGVELTVQAHRVLEDAKIGDSIAVSGVCLTVVDLVSEAFRVDVVAETLRRTTLGAVSPGARLNLERAVTLQTRLGGHLVSGHVDGVGTVEEVGFEGDSAVVEVRVPAPLQKYIAEKGSVAVDGVSLTVMGVTEKGFRVALIPHTQKETTLGELRSGSRVNLEVDVVARYVERLLRGGHEVK
ncbi:riboflavin synthase [Kyrpidia spormannii]|uniref:Riboflavin synthase n=1 Tax=Kyrpidia spormannii TaxID=2055160 RepID=A0A2K8N627_9BACL|nr:riboflavin synthase [Kyrpidia spormannii]ATY84753.1 riboflavin synthase [Kyrpidia spormannii]